MKYEFDKNDEVIESYDLWELEEKDQEYLKDLLKRLGFDKYMDIENAFIPKEEEEIEILGIEDLFPNATITILDGCAPAAPKSRLIDATSKTIKMSAEANDFILGNKVKYSDKVEHIPLSKLVEIDNSMNFFPLPDDEELLNLMESIEKFGILTPLLTIKDSNFGQYIVVCGRSRLVALNHLYNSTQDEEYLYAPCLLLDENTDASTIQSIIISTNLSYKKCQKIFK